MTHLKYFLRGNITDIIADAIVISTNEGKSISCCSLVFRIDCIFSIDCLKVSSI